MPCLSQQTLRRLLALATLTLLSATLALAQDVTSPSKPGPPPPRSRTWAGAQLVADINTRVLVVTTDDLKGLHACKIRTITSDQLVCQVHRGMVQTYSPQRVAALIAPGRRDKTGRRMLAVALVGGGLIAGAVYLVPVTIVGAVALGLGGGFLLQLEPYIAMGADSDIPDSLLYVAPGQTLKVKLRI